MKGADARLSAFGTSRPLAGAAENKPEAAKAAIDREEGRIIGNDQEGARLEIEE